MVLSKGKKAEIAYRWSRKKNPPLIDPVPETVLLLKYIEKCKIHFVEIGTYNGGASALISKYLPKNVNLTTIDIFKKPPKGSVPPPGDGPSLKEARETIKKEGKISKVKIIKGVSWEVAKSWKKPIDVLFIDGDHRYEAVKRDFTSWESHVVKGGFILIHDINFKGVKKAFKEVIKNKRFFLQEIVGTFAVIKKLK